MINLAQVGGNAVTYGPAIDVNVTAMPPGGSTTDITAIAGNVIGGAELPVVAAALPLPAGAATAAAQLPNDHDVTVTNFPATQPVSAAALPLPAGAATSAAQLPNDHDVTVTNFPATQPVSAAALPLPAGAATAAAQLPNDHDVTVTNFPASSGVTAPNSAPVFTTLGYPPQTDSSHYVLKFGGSSSIASGTERIIQAGSFPYTGFLTAATTVRIKAGGNAADTAAGVGARSIVVKGLDATGAELEETIVCAGASASTSTTGTFVRVWRCQVLTTGTYAADIDGSNVGDIVVETTGGVELATIPADRGSTSLGVYTVPLGFEGYVTALGVTTDAPIRVRMKTRAGILTVAAPFTPAVTRLTAARVDPELQRDLSSAPVFVDELTDIFITAQRVTGSATTASVTFGIFLRPRTA